MPHDRVQRVLNADLAKLEAEGRRKAAETVVTGVIAPKDGKGPRFLLAGEGTKPFLRMNANNYLGLSHQPEVIAAEEDAVRGYGSGPGAVRFIGGTWAPHVELEQRLARFHGREASLIFSSAYGAMMGVLPQLMTAETAVISDALNHNCIINAIRLGRPKLRSVYRHSDMAQLEQLLGEAARSCRRAIVVTDGIFSMRGDFTPLDAIAALIGKHDAAFAENALLVVDDSHGVGAFGPTGRGTEEQTGAKADILIGTLGKAFGVNGGYVAASRIVIDYLRETSPFYVYSNPIAPGEAAAAAAAVALVDSDGGRARLHHLRDMTSRFRDGLARLKLETIPGQHPIVPLMVRNSGKTAALVAHLRRHGILATGLNFPVVPRGDEEIRFQLCADHTPDDIDETLAVLGSFSEAG
jgi:glycine C-acetyltransferase